MTEDEEIKLIKEAVHWDAEQFRFVSMQAQYAAHGNTADPAYLLYCEREMEAYNSMMEAVQALGYNPVTYGSGLLYWGDFKDDWVRDRVTRLLRKNRLYVRGVPDDFDYRHPVNRQIATCQSPPHGGAQGQEA